MGEYALSVGTEAIERLQLLDDIHAPYCDAFLTRAIRPEMRRVLDLGCGVGFTTARLARLCATDVEVVGIDRNGSQVEIARQLVKNANVSFLVCDLLEESLDFTSFDLVYGRFVLGHNVDSAALLRSLYDRLSPGSALAIEEPDIGTAFVVNGGDSMEQAEALYVRLGKALGQEFAAGIRLGETAVALDAGAEILCIQPLLTTSRHKRLYALGLLECRPRYIEHGISSSTELDALSGALQLDIVSPATFFASARVAQILLWKPTRSEEG